MATRYDLQNVLGRLYSDGISVQELMDLFGGNVRNLAGFLNGVESLGADAVGPEVPEDEILFNGYFMERDNQLVYWGFTGTSALCSTETQWLDPEIMIKAWDEENE